MYICTYIYTVLPREKIFSHRKLFGINMLTRKHHFYSFNANLEVHRYDVEYPSKRKV